jgi:hypothetical protein
MNLIQAMEDPNLFGPHFSGPSWANWRAVLKGAFSPASITDQERAVYVEATKRQRTPSDLRELWAIVGRRGGKDTITASLAVRRR